MGSKSSEVSLQITSSSLHVGEVEGDFIGEESMTTIHATSPITSAMKLAMSYSSAANV